MEILGYLASVLIGISLGLIGSGGSILTVPVLVYLFSVDAVSATAYSLFIVGFTAAIGSVAYFRKGLVNVKTALVFGIPSIVAVFLTRAFIVPAIPKEVFSLGGFVVSKGLLLMVLFAVLMIAASYSMIKKDKKREEKSDIKDSDNDQLKGAIFKDRYTVKKILGKGSFGRVFLVYDQTDKVE